MKAIELEDLRPEAAEFYIKRTDKTYRLRALNLDDERWLRVTFGEKIAEAVQSVDGLCQVAFQLLESEHKRDFVATETETVDEDGQIIKTRVGGWRLLSTMISGPAEKICLYRAVATCFGLSRPVAEAVNAYEKEKKTLAAGLAGQPSSTSSRPNTDGPTSTSGRSRPEKSPSHSEKSKSGRKTSSPSKRVCTDLKYR